MKKLFGETKISWKNLLIFSLLLGIVVGVLKKIPLLNNTSFQDIAVVLDMWIILAIFIIVNAENWKEAVIKCFVFFMISQPVIYFTELIIDVVFNKKEFLEMFLLYFRNYYIGAGWLTWTILTIPGSFIAYQIKKENILAAIILSVATGYLAFVGGNGFLNAILVHFPYHLLNSLICLGMAYYLIFLIIKKKKLRIVSIGITSVCLLAGVGMMLYSFMDKHPANMSDDVTLGEGEMIVSASITDETVATINYYEDNYVNINTGNKIGTTTLLITLDSGTTYEYLITVTKQKMEIVKK